MFHLFLKYNRFCHTKQYKSKCAIRGCAHYARDRLRTSAYTWARPGRPRGALTTSPLELPGTRSRPKRKAPLYSQEGCVSEKESCIGIERSVPTLTGLLAHMSPGCSPLCLDGVNPIGSVKLFDTAPGVSVLPRSGRIVGRIRLRI